MSTIIGNRLGNTTEDIATISGGALAQNTAAMDGYDVLAVPLSSKVPGSARKLFDVLKLDIKTAPRGIAMTRFTLVHCDGLLCSGFCAHKDLFFGYERVLLYGVFAEFVCVVFN